MGLGLLVDLFNTLSWGLQTELEGFSHQIYNLKSNPAFLCLDHVEHVLSIVTSTTFSGVMADKVYTWLMWVKLFNYMYCIVKLKRPTSGISIHDGYFNCWNCKEWQRTKVKIPFYPVPKKVSGQQPDCDN